MAAKRSGRAGTPDGKEQRAQRAAAEPREPAAEHATRNDREHRVRKTTGTPLLCRTTSRTQNRRRRTFPAPSSPKAASSSALARPARAAARARRGTCPHRCRRAVSDAGSRNQSARCRFVAPNVSPGGRSRVRSDGASTPHRRTRSGRRAAPGRLSHASPWLNVLAAAVQGRAAPCQAGFPCLNQPAFISSANRAGRVGSGCSRFPGHLNRC